MYILYEFIISSFIDMKCYLLALNVFLYQTTEFFSYFKETFSGVSAKLKLLLKYTKKRLKITYVHSHSSGPYMSGVSKVGWTSNHGSVYCSPSLLKEIIVKLIYDYRKRHAELRICKVRLTDCVRWVTQQVKHWTIMSLIL